MTKNTNNTQLAGYKEFVQSLEKIGEALLDKYDLAYENSEIITEINNKDEAVDMVICAADENGTRANTFGRINLKDLYKQVQVELMKKIVLNLNGVEPGEEFDCFWDEDDYDMTEDEFMVTLVEAQKTFNAKADHILQDAEILSEITGIPENTDKSIREITKAYVNFFAKEYKYFDQDVSFSPNGFTVVAVYQCPEDSGMKNIRYEININVNLIITKALCSKIAHEDIMDFVSKEIRQQLKTGLNDFPTVEWFNALKVKGFILKETFVKVEKFFKKIAEEIV